MKKFLKTAATEYYKGEPIISDSQFDYLANKYGFDDLGAKEGDVKHLYPMYSLRKIYTDEGKTDSELSGATIVTPKLDGASLEIVYEDGYLNAGTTRGDGITGKDCTHNVLVQPDIPNLVPYPHKLQVTGEMIVEKTVKNARNVAAGALNLKDIDKFLSRKVTFIAYGILPVTEYTYLEEMKLLKSWGFNVVTESNWLQFPQDGSVFRLDNNDEFEAAGYTSKHPKGAFALKIRDEEPLAETTLRKVDWQVGKGGKVTPVAYFDTVVIDDANISKATLNNAGFVEDLKLDIGDRILIRRAGKIIPQVVQKI